MTIAADLLREAKRAPVRETLAEHRDTIATLRKKNYTWREIADFFNERGVATDHTKIYRFMQRNQSGTMNTYDNFFVPTAEAYAKALEAITINDTQKKMLAFHCRAHNRTVTYTELANAAGAEDHRAANSQYGKLGRTLGEHLAMNFAIAEARDEPFYSSAIGSDNPYKSAKSEYQLVMHHELAKAIQSLGWFAGSSERQA